MTKLEFEVVESKKSKKEKELDGVYLAQNDKPNDRILIFEGGRFIGAIGKSFVYEKKFKFQTHQNPGIYKNLKKVKKITMEIEVEE